MACSFSSSIFTPFPTRTRTRTLTRNRTGLYLKPSTGNPPTMPTRIRICSVQTDGNAPEPIKKFHKREYKYGFSSNSEPFFPEGISESTVRSISTLKSEPDWMLRFRLAAVNRFRSMPEPKWSDNVLPPIDLDPVCYFSEPKLNNPDSVDPGLLESFRKLGVTLNEEDLANVAMVDSTYLATLYRVTLLKAGIIFCSISEAIREYPDLVRKYLGKVVPPGDNYYAALNSAFFSDGSFCYVPKNTVSPMAISSYLRFNRKMTGQFERTLIIAEENSFVSYLEACCAPNYSMNQLHTEVVELYCAAGAEIKYSTVQDRYRGDEQGRNGIYNFETRRGICDGPRSRISWTQVETGSAITCTSTSVVLKGDDTVGEFYSVALTRDCQQADTETKMIHVGKNSRSKIISKVISAGKLRNCYRWLVNVEPQAENARNFSQCDSMLMGDTAGANTYPDIQVKNPTARVEQEANSLEIGNEQLSGIDHEKAVMAMIGGFCRDVLERFPPGFASEVNNTINCCWRGV